jgi:hypothetical protein
MRERSFSAPPVSPPITMRVPSGERRMKFRLLFQSWIVRSRGNSFSSRSGVSGSVAIM